MDGVVLDGVGMSAYLAVSTVLFIVGFAGVALNRRNLVITLLSLEIMLLGAATGLAGFSAVLDDRTGELILLALLGVVAAKAAIATALMIALYRNRGSGDVADINLLRG